jgi:hypothetical protein
VEMIGASLHIKSSLSNFSGFVVPIEVPKEIDALILKINQYISGLDSNPFFSELPFRTKSVFLDPLSDFRIALSNLNRGVKPCLYVAKQVQPPSPFPAPLPKTVLARGFI